MKIHVLDPGLASVAGHHADMCARVGQSLERAGHQVTLYTHRSFAPPASSPFNRLAWKAHFSNGPYQPSDSLDAVAGELIHFLHHSEQLADDLLALPPADAWVWPSLFAPQLHACAMHGFSGLISGCLHVPVDYMAPEYGHGWWRYAHLSTSQRKLRLNLGSIEQDVIDSYRGVFPEGMLKLFPVYLDGMPSSPTPGKPLTIGFFGHQREEKGGSLLLELVQQLKGRFRVLVHDSQGLLAESLQNEDQVEVHGYVDDLSRLICRCDLVVLPYSPEQYKAKGSGILWEAVGSGVPVVAPAKSTPGRFVLSHNAGTVFEDFTVQGIVQAIDQLSADHARHKAHSMALAAEWQTRHGIEAFMKTFVFDALPKPTLPKVSYQFGITQFHVKPN
jgi:glycosyltransferase involved in cell wall biosynthesis